jgi:hypothetical protein
MEMINNSRGLYQATPHLNNNNLSRRLLMSKNIYNPLNLDNPIPFDFDDLGDHEPFTGGSAFDRTGIPCSAEQRKSISEAKMGKPMSIEARKKISDYANNMTAEHKKKLSDGQKRRYARGDFGMGGKKHSEESKKKMSESYWNNIK